MNSSDVLFDENLELYTSINESSNQICITLSDDLDASEEELTEKYKSKIAKFINDSSKWYEIAILAVINRGKNEYNKEVQKNDIQLMNVFVLYEQDEKELFGLQFRVSFDIEHGCGLKITGDNYEITELGDGDVAFC
ncbi:hypothetical protein [Aquimarina sp. 2201CG14-23]|uniref:hypothetical protein n=1 Tax=Aquimarina mycalae TaxID=3040073 RepID=UPI002477DED6|nr:hypothetical protein [Aquimarina sp. 2201CG14-23]MDH7446819.1 hypothetical protein [Aquimarina sp. 2201CG14-23]